MTVTFNNNNIKKKQLKSYYSELTFLPPIFLENKIFIILNTNIHVIYFTCFT